MSSSRAKGLMHLLIMYFEIISEFELLNRSFWSISKASCKACRIRTDLTLILLTWIIW